MTRARRMERVWWAVGIIVIAGVALTTSILVLMPQQQVEAENTHVFAASRAEQERIWNEASYLIYAVSAYRSYQLATTSPVRLGLGESAWIWVTNNPQLISPKLFNFMTQQTSLNFSEAQVLLLFNNVALPSYRNFNPATGTFYKTGEEPTTALVTRLGMYRYGVESNVLLFDATNFNDAAIANVTNLGVYYLV